MYIIATFDHSKKIEMALADLKNRGLDQDAILALPLDNRASSSHLLDSKNQTDRESFFDIAAILGMIFMLLGSIYGFVLKWGPIIWGLIGLIIGILAGLAVKIIYLRGKTPIARDKNKTLGEIVVIIHCDYFQEENVKQILWDNNALGWAVYKN